MNMRLLENDTVAGWVMTAGLHSLAVGLLFWIVIALVRRNGPTESCWFGRAGAVALLMLPLTLLAVGTLNRKSPPPFEPISRAATVTAEPTPTPTQKRLVLPAPTHFAPAKAMSAPKDFGSIAANTLGGAWLVGMLFLLTRALLGAEKMRRLRKQLRSVNAHADPALIALLEKIGIAPARVRVAETEVVPFVTGLLAPVIVVPANLCASLKPHEARMILRHERAHLRNRDLPWAFVQGLARILHWWNPFARSVLRQTELASEGLCDHAALSGERGRNGKAYAHCLVNLAERTTRFRQPACALSVTGDFRRLKCRLLWIANPRSAPRAKSRTFLKLLSVALVIASALGLTVLNAGAQLPAKQAPVATTTLETGNSSITKIGNLEIKAEQGTFHGDEPRITFSDVKIVTPFYECRAKTAEYRWDKDHPKDLEKASLTLKEGVFGEFGDQRLMSESATIAMNGSSIQFAGFPRATSGHQLSLATSPETVFELKFAGERMSDIFVKGPARYSIVPSDSKTASKALLPKAPNPPAEPRRSKEGLKIDADNTGYENGICIARGNVRVKDMQDGIELEITGEAVDYIGKSSQLEIRGRAIVKLRGQKIWSEHAKVNIAGMTAMISGPGFFEQDNKEVPFDEGTYVYVDDEGVHLIPSKSELFFQDVHGILHGIHGFEPGTDTPMGETNPPTLRGTMFRDVGSASIDSAPEMPTSTKHIPVGDIYSEGWDMWREKRLNRSLYPSAPEDSVPIEPIQPLAPLPK